MRRNRKNHYVLFLLLLALSANIYALFEVVFPSIVDFKVNRSQNSYVWSVQADFPPGDYFVSGGEPEGLCELRIDGINLESLDSRNRLTQTALSLVYTFSVERLQKKEILVVCHVEEGQFARLRYKPYVSTHLTGMLVHGSRLFSSFVFPSIAITFILFSLTVILRNRRDLRVSASLIACAGLFGVLHTLSLMRLGYLFFPITGYLVFHAVLKVLLVTSLLLRFSRSGKLRIGLFTVALLSIGAFFVGYMKGAGEFHFFYKVFCHLIPLFAACVYLQLKINDSKLRFPVKSGYFLIPFVVISIFDCVAIDFEYGVYNSMVATVLFFLFHLERVFEIREGKSLANRLVDDAIVSPGEIGIAQIRQVALAIGRFFETTRWAVYLGYGPDGSEAYYTQVEKLNGSLEVERNTLVSAIQAQEPVIVAAQNTTLILLPVGHSCICIEKNSTLSKSDYFIEEILKEAYPRLRLLVRSMLETESAIQASGSRIRSRLGVGERAVEFGAIFADIVAFSQHIKFSEQFLDFFYTKYLPQLMRELGSDVFIKDIFGDELFLVVISSSAPVPQKSLDAALRILRFSEKQGAALCKNLGFKPIEFRIGASVGTGRALITTTQITLSGPVIEAKRCQNRARRSEPFFSDTLISNSNLEGLDGQAVKETFAAKGEILCGFRWIRL